MPTKAQKVLVIQDASMELCTEALQYALLSLSLESGDKIKLLRLVPLSKPSSGEFSRCLSYLTMNKRKLHSISATHKKKQDVMEKEIEEKKEECSNNATIANIYKIAQDKQVELELAFEGGSLREVTVENAGSFGATTVIIDRQLKQDEKYLRENLTCQILRMRHDNSVKHVRGNREPEDHEMHLDKERSSNANMETSTRKQQEEIISLCSKCEVRRPWNQHTREFSWSELQSATSSFSLQSLISVRGSRVYEGRMTDGQMVAIRELTSETIKSKEFTSIVQKLGRIRHENVTILLGSCSKGSHRLLVYEYICYGSLNRHLSEKSSHLTWERRVRIAYGAAKGLEYLHGLEIYGNVRPSNILLTHEHQPLLANMGLARNQYEASNQPSDTRVLKTFEYLAPECEETGIDLSKADVFSFGVVLLELITGRKTIDETNGQSYLRWARPLLRQKRFHDLMDPTVQDSHDLHQFYWMVRLAEKCICWDPKRRFSVQKVVKALKFISEGAKMECISPTDSEMEQMYRSF